MPGVELKASVRDGQVVVTLRGELDVTSAADAEVVLAAPQPYVVRLLALTGSDKVLCVQAAAAAAGTASRGTLGAGLRCALHALGGQPHRILISG
jgi:anti-anti-sigma regulatory factor